MTQHKWAKEIRAWAAGQEIEYRSAHSNHEWRIDRAPPWSHMGLEFRIKPERKVLRYRVALMSPMGTEPYTATAQEPEDEDEMSHDESFARWLTDWIEVEL